MIHYNWDKGLSDLNVTVSQAVEDLYPYAGEFDSIATSGTSGLVVASPVAVLMNKPLLVVRKADEVLRCWHSHDVENYQNAGRRVLFLDDEVQRGRTLRHVTEQVSRNTGGYVTARYEYKNREYRVVSRLSDTPWEYTQ